MRPPREPSRSGGAAPAAGAPCGSWALARSAPAAPGRRSAPSASGPSAPPAAGGRRAPSGAGGSGAAATAAGGGGPACAVWGAHGAPCCAAAGAAASMRLRPRLRLSRGRCCVAPAAGAPCGDWAPAVAAVAAASSAPSARAARSAPGDAPPPAPVPARSAPQRLSIASPGLRAADGGGALAFRAPEGSPAPQTPQSGAPSVPEGVRGVVLPHLTAALAQVGAQIANGAERRGAGTAAVALGRAGRGSRGFRGPNHDTAARARSKARHGARWAAADAAGAQLPGRQLPKGAPPPPPRDPAARRHQQAPKHCGAATRRAPAPHASLPSRPPRPTPRPPTPPHPTRAPPGRPCRPLRAAPARGRRPVGAPCPVGCRRGRAGPAGGGRAGRPALEE
jgi:hypothetical protein